MSVRMAIVKLSAVVAGGALIGGGAVHMAEKSAGGKPHYIKHARQAAKAPVHHWVKRAQPRAKATDVVSTDCQTIKCQPHEELAVVAMPAPAIPPAPPPPPEVEDTGDYHAFGGPYIGGFYQPLGGRTVIIDRNHHHQHSSTSTSTSTSAGGTPVPAPPMLILFGMAAAAMMGRRTLVKKFT